MSDEISRTQSATGNADVVELPLHESVVEDETADEVMTAVQSILEDTNLPLSRSFSNIVAELAQPVTATQLKIHLNQAFPLQAALHAVVVHFDSLDVIFKHSIAVVNHQVNFETRIKTTLDMLKFCQDNFLEGSPILRQAIALGGFIFMRRVLKGERSDNVKGVKARRKTGKVLSGILQGQPSIEAMLTDTVRCRKLEILRRYGDYLAERLKVLRQHIFKSNSEKKHLLSGLWTDTSATLRHEEGKDSTSCHDLINKAAKDLKWDPEMRVFMIHSYGARNSLMHSEFPRLVSKKDWPTIAQHCDDDIVKLPELFIASDKKSKDAISHWRQIIREFKDSWVHQVDASSSWEAQPIIQEALAVGIREPLLLYELSMKHRHDDAQTRQQAVADLVNEQNAKEPSIKELQEEIERLKGTLAAGGTQTSTMDLLDRRNEEIKGLKSDNEKGQREMRKIKERLTIARKKQLNSTAMANSKKKRRRSWPTATRTEVEGLNSRLGTTASDVWIKCIGLELRNTKYVRDNKWLKKELEESQTRCEGLFSRFSAAQCIRGTRGVAASSEAAKKMIDDEHKRMPRVTMRQATVNRSDNDGEDDGDENENNKRSRSRSF